MIVVNPDRTDALIDTLATLWEVSVRSTHHFLTEDDIQKLALFVKTGLSGVETLLVASENHKSIAFMGIEFGKIEMLFVLPDYFVLWQRGWKAVSRVFDFTIRGAVCRCERAKSASDRILQAYRI